MSMSAAITAYIGLGSNLENPEGQVLSARAEIAALANVREIAFSPLYESEPMGPADQPKYINAVMGVNTTLPPLELLHALQKIEFQHGRVRGPQRWGARTLDLDVLLYGKVELSTPELTIPHTGLTARAFVLYPLRDCQTDLYVPGKGRLQDLLADCPFLGLRRLTDYDEPAR